MLLSSQRAAVGQGLIARSRPCGPFSAINSRQQAAPIYCAKSRKKTQKKPKPQKPKKRVSNKGYGPDLLSSFGDDGWHPAAELLDPLGFGRLDQMLGAGLQNPGKLTEMALAQKGRLPGHMQHSMDESLPPFHKEAAGLIKRTLDKASANAVQQKLDEAHFHAVFQSVSFMAVLSDDPHLVITPEAMLSRLGMKIRDKAAMRWFETADAFSVRLNDKTLPYDTDNEELQSFTNSPVEDVHMLPGSTHVAVGFTDLGSLAAAVSRWKVDNCSRDGQLRAAPLEFDESTADWGDMHSELSRALTAQLAEDSDSELEPVMQQANFGADAESNSQPDTSSYRLTMQSISDAVSIGAAGSNGGVNCKALQYLHAVQQLNHLSNRADISSNSYLETAAEETARPLQWVGYEASAYAVAKTAVIAEMIGQSADTDSILQVWYSSCWSHTTAKQFKQALKDLLSRKTHSSQKSAAVVQILQHWQQSRDVPLTRSRREWLESVSRANVFLGALTQHRDRVAVARYMFTGELLQADVGSTVMFSIPSRQGKRATDERFLQSISLSSLLRARSGPPVDRAGKAIWTASGDGQQRDVVEAGVAVLRRRIGNLKQLVVDGAISIQVRHAKVLPGDKAIINEIRQLKPDSMSWSNVPDYFGAKVLIQAYHMGAGFVDRQLALIGAVDFLRDPPVENARNLIDFCLYCTTFQVWIEAFVKLGTQQETIASTNVKQQLLDLLMQDSPQAGIVEQLAHASSPDTPSEEMMSVTLGPPTYAPWSRTNSTLSLAFVQFGNL